MYCIRLKASALEWRRGGEVEFLSTVDSMASVTARTGQRRRHVNPPKPWPRVLTEHGLLSCAVGVLALALDRNREAFPACH